MVNQALTREAILIRISFLEEYARRFPRMAKSRKREHNRDIRHYKLMLAKLDDNK